MKYHGIIGSLLFTAVFAASCANNPSAEFAEKTVEQKKSRNLLFSGNE